MPAILELRTDASLVRGAIHGKPRALESLIFRYQRKAYAVARAVARDPDLADDIVQEAFLLAIQKLPTLRVHGSFGPWFLEIVRNVARKSRRREPVRFIPEPEPRPVEDLDTLEVRELRQRVWAEVEKLPESLREAVFLYYHEGRSVREVARALEISNAAAKKRLQSGREALSERLWRALEDTLREIVPSTREWRRTGRRLALVTVAALSSTRPAAAVGGATAAAAGGAKVVAGIGTLGGIIIMKKAILSAAVAAVLITGGIAIWSTTDSWPGRGEDTPLEPETSSGGPTAAEKRLARQVEERELELARLEAENRRLRNSMARRGTEAAPPVAKTATETTGQAATDAIATTAGSGIDWSSLSKLIAENVDLMVKARENAEAGAFTAEEQALMMKISSEFMIVSAAALKRSTHPIFDPVIFDELAQAVYGQSLGLTEEQSTNLAAANAQILDELLGDTDPAELVPTERFHLRREATAALKGAIEGILDPSQHATWESIQDLGDFVFEGPLATRELGLEIPNVVTEVGRAWIETFQLTDAEARAFGPLAIEYVDLARQTLERHAIDEDAFNALSAEQRSRLDEELYELQRRYDERIEPTLDDERFEKYMKGMPTLLRFRFGKGASMSQKSGVF